MDLKISKKKENRWFSRWINNVAEHLINGSTIKTKDFEGVEEIHTFEPLEEYITEVKYFNIHTPPKNEN